jgi:hypothetical protein
VREVKRNRDDRGEQKTCEQNMTSASNCPYEIK